MLSEMKLMYSDMHISTYLFSSVSEFGSDFQSVDMCKASVWPLDGCRELQQRAKEKEFVSPL